MNFTVRISLCHAVVTSAATTELRVRLRNSWQKTFHTPHLPWERGRLQETHLEPCLYLLQITMHRPLFWKKHTTNQLPPPQASVPPDCNTLSRGLLALAATEGARVGPGTGLGSISEQELPYLSQVFAFPKRLLGRCQRQGKSVQFVLSTLSV